MNMPPKIKFFFPRGNFPRLCLIGNSNVGKSSLTKLLLSHPRWYKSKIGKTAGSTVRLTIINDPNLNYHMIDLPGFGRMIRLSRQSQDVVQNQILKYVDLDARNIFLMIIVISAERLDDELEKWFFKKANTIPLSIEFIQLMEKHAIPCVVVLNKIDRLNKYHRKQLQEKFLHVLSEFNIEIASSHNNIGLLDIIETSAKEKNNPGMSELKQLIASQAAQLDLNKFDPRSTLLDKLPIDVQAKQDRKAQKKKEYSDKTSK
jgi:GTP-binding protein EngB required for normal cell division